MPEGHLIGLSDTISQLYPCGHIVHVVLPVAFEKYPSGHGIGRSPRVGQ